MYERGRIAMKIQHWNEWIRWMLIFNACVSAVLLCGSAAAGSEASMPDASNPTPPTLRRIEVPIDHTDPSKGTAEIVAELGAPYNPEVPTIFVIADAQQFYVQKGAMAGIQERYFNSNVNVVGIIGRGFTKAFIRAASNVDGAPDWKKAWTIFNADQWIEDIEAVRRDIVGESGTIRLFGQSGGGFLGHQYMAKHGEHVDRAATSSALNPFIAGELGLNSDRFWEEIEQFKPGLREVLKSVLEHYANRRDEIIMTLQRQNFFVSPEQLPEARARLIHALANDDMDLYTQMKETYQVGPIRNFLNSPQGIPIRVRLYEFIYPAGILERLEGDAVYPDLENQKNFAEPLLALQADGSIAAPTWDRRKLHRLDTTVLVINGVQDHTSDYRAAAALAYCYPNSTLFLADDDHQFHRMAKGGIHSEIIRAFLIEGPESDAFQNAVACAEPFRWRE